MEKVPEFLKSNVAIKTNKYDINAYSSQPHQIDAWLNAYKQAVEICGEGSLADKETPAEQQFLRRIKTQGFFVKKRIKHREKIRRDQVFFAIPPQKNQLKSDDWSEHLISNRAYEENEPLEEAIKKQENKQQFLDKIKHQVQGICNEARIPLNKKWTVEISHHYGLKRFYEIGAIIINCINRQYCKKIILQFPNQKHPKHFHANKEETFQLIHGDLKIDVEGIITELKVGESILIPPKTKHSFWTSNGCIFEELSNTYHENDSFYDDKQIQKQSLEERKTIIRNFNF